LRPALKEESGRKKVVRDYVEKVKENLNDPGVRLSDLRTWCMHVLALYGKDSLMEEEVREATELLKEIDRRRPKSTGPR
jgi:hypothetical protein